MLHQLAHNIATGAMVAGIGYCGLWVISAGVDLVRLGVKPKTKGGVCQATQKEPRAPVETSGGVELGSVGAASVQEPTTQEKIDALAGVYADNTAKALGTLAETSRVVPGTMGVWVYFSDGIATRIAEQEECGVGVAGRARSFPDTAAHLTSHKAPETNHTTHPIPKEAHLAEPTTGAEDVASHEAAIQRTRALIEAHSTSRVPNVSYGPISVLYDPKNDKGSGYSSGGVVSGDAGLFGDHRPDEQTVKPAGSMTYKVSKGSNTFFSSPSLSKAQLEKMGRDAARLYLTSIASKRR